jgi:hypothetical protein
MGERLPVSWDYSFYSLELQSMVLHKTRQCELNLCLTVPWNLADNFRFIASRLIIGFEISFLIQTSPILISELSYPSHRGRISGMYYCTYVC